MKDDSYIPKGNFSKQVKHGEIAPVLWVGILVCPLMPWSIANAVEVDCYVCALGTLKRSPRSQHWLIRKYLYGSGHLSYTAFVKKLHKEKLDTDYKGAQGPRTTVKSGETCRSRSHDLSNTKQRDVSGLFTFKMLQRI